MIMIYVSSIWGYALKQSVSIVRVNVNGLIILIQTCLFKPLISCYTKLNNAGLMQIILYYTFSSWIVLELYIYIERAGVNVTMQQYSIYKYV